MVAVLNITIVCEGFSRFSLRLQPWLRVYEMSKRLVANKNVVTILSNKIPRCPDIERIDGILIYRIEDITWAPLIRKKHLLKSIGDCKPDIIVWYGTPLSSIYLTQLKSIEKPIIWDIDSELHDLKLFKQVSILEMLHPHHGFLWQKIAIALLPKVIVKCVANSSIIEKLIVPSRSLKSSLCRIGVKPEKVAIVPSTIEKAAFCFDIDCRKKQESKRALGFAADRFVATFLGSPCALRGADTAILGMPAIIEESGNVDLVVLSRRSLEDSNSESYHLRNEESHLVKLTKRLKMQKHVRIIPGILGKTDLALYMSASDAIVLPFKLVLSEPPVCILEAMSMGKVVVTTNLKALSEIVDDRRGMLIEPRRHLELAQSLLFLAKHPEHLHYLGKNANEYVMTLPDWEEVASQFMDVLYDSVKTGELQE